MVICILHCWRVVPLRVRVVPTPFGLSLAAVRTEPVEGPARTPPLSVRADPSIPQDRVRTTCVSKPCWLIAPSAARTRNRPPSIVRRRRDFAPAGESLSFVLPNESNQSKGALICHSGVATRRDLSPTAIHRTTEHLLDLLHHSARFASPRSEASPWERCEASCLLLGPVGGVEERRALGWRA